jgi:hypothetical protein
VFPVRYELNFSRYLEEIQSLILRKNERNRWHPHIHNIGACATVAG